MSALLAIIPPDRGLFRNRIARAEELAEGASEATPLLRFFAAVADLQEPLFLHPRLSTWLLQTPQAPAAPTVRDVLWLTFQEELDLFRSDLVRLGPEGLGASLRANEARAEELVRLVLAGDEAEERGGPVTLFMGRAFLEPFAARIAMERAVPPRGRAGPGPGPHEGPPGSHAPGPACPSCGFQSVVALLADTGGRTGARLLQCGLCSTRWSVPRLTCPACLETSPDQQAAKQSERWPHVRLDVCRTCGTYVKTIDLRTDGRAVPEVDDVDSSALDLWASGEGWNRLGAGLLTP